ncbi:MAG: hypothetical protein HZA84_08740 [Thaumarchaeota archaeon]|nr:hypothetical protein [Nitrososphaerota archaeon]
MRRNIDIIVLISITVMIVVITNSSEAYAKSEKTYYYSDNYGYHKIQYSLKYGEITKIECSQGGLTIDVNTKRDDVMVLFVPKTLLDMTGQVNIDISVNSTQTVGGSWDYNREQLDDSLKLTFEVEKGYSPTRIQTSVYARECKVAPPEDTHYKLNSLKTQLENGILPQKIICKQDQTLIFKTSDRSPACVKPETKKILAERSYHEERIWIRLKLDCNLSGCMMPIWICPQGHTENPQDQFMAYFKNKNIEILDTKTRLTSTNNARCEWGECGGDGIEFSFHIFKNDFEKITDEGFDLVR